MGAVEARLPKPNAKAMYDPCVTCHIPSVGAQTLFHIIVEDNVMLAFEAHQNSQRRPNGAHRKVTLSSQNRDEMAQIELQEANMAPTSDWSTKQP